ncbi:MAG TPA: tagaturonate reductase [Tepidisphaeraceae bacterium]|jgi:tagaturonate reductase
MTSTLPPLTRSHLNLPPAPPERVLQFGEGVFLRAFVDWMIDELNERNLFNGGVAVVKPRGGKSIEVFNQQQGLYTLLTRGLQDGKPVDESRVIRCITRGLDPLTQWDDVLTIARDPNVRFVVSNTTEAGIAVDAADRFADTPPKSFPAKLTRLLHERWTAFAGASDKGWIVLPCELIEANGTTLRALVINTARAWSLDPAFVAWVSDACVFCNTLVDRIVTGRPSDTSEMDARLGYKDELLNAAEPYHALVVEGPKWVADELPLHKAGLNVVWTDDAAPYRTRKVRLLNGAHTMMVAAAFLAGHDTVRQAMDDPAIRDFVRGGLFEEILPTLDQPKDELEAFANSVLERFANPFVEHRLLAIAMNSTSKFKARLLGSLKDHVARTEKLPERIAFSLSALIVFYEGKLLREHAVQDDASAVAAIQQAWTLCDVKRTVEAILRDAKLWGEDLTPITGLTEAVTGYATLIRDRGIQAAMANSGPLSRYDRERVRVRADDGKHP